MPLNTDIGLQEGETCNRDGCTGKMINVDERSCSCFINPPCGKCVEPTIQCDECGEFA